MTTNTGEEKKVQPATVMNAATKEYKDKTHAAVQQLYDISKTEVMTPSVGDAYTVTRDPHLRLRRTLAPSLNVGLPKYAEAQFMLSKSETTGKRISLEFSVDFDGTRKYFTMDGYAFGASEQEATVRIVTLHGISSGVSRTRWHKLGERYNIIHEQSSSSSSSNKKVRFVALDWHSIDRSVDDDTNTEFLTCLPKHIMEVSPTDVENIATLHASEGRQEWYRGFARAVSSGVCPRGFDDGARLLRGVIDEGLGWGKVDTPFILGMKSWSGGLAMRFLSQLNQGGSEEDKAFAENIQAAIIMHPGCFDKKDITDVMSSGIIKTALMVWAKDDPLIPYPVTQLYLDAASSNGDDEKIKFISYERGGHHNFDGTDDLPNFDDSVIEWVNSLP